MEDFHRISLTAKFTAYMRQFSDIPFAKDVAAYIHANEAVEAQLLKQQTRWEGMMWYAPMLEMRYKSIAELIRKLEIRQVLELASGFSLRGLAMTENPALTYVETDLEALNMEKSALISTLYKKYDLVRTGNHHIATANAMEAGQLLEAARFFRNNQPIAIVSEGLLPYLTEEERETIARNVCGLLKMYGGVWITPDFALKEHMERRSEQQKQFHRLIAEATGRTIWASAFESENAMQAFFKSLDLQAQRQAQAGLVPHLLSEQILGEATSQFWGRVKPILSVWTLKLTN